MSNWVVACWWLSGFSLGYAVHGFVFILQRKRIVAELKKEIKFGGIK